MGQGPQPVGTAFWRGHLAARMLALQAGDTGSSPVRVTTARSSSGSRTPASHAGDTSSSLVRVTKRLTCATPRVIAPCMITIEKVEVPASTSERHHTTCEKCGEPSGDDESRDAYERRTVVIRGPGGPVKATLNIFAAAMKKATIEMENGDTYPESSSVEALVIDCCTECFVKHVVPALEAIGFKARIEDRSW